MNVLDVVKAIQQAVPWVAGLPLLPKLIFSAIVLLSAFFLLALVWTSPAAVDRRLLHHKLDDQLQELSTIEARWDERQHEVETLAPLMVAVLQPNHPRSAAAISDALSSPTLRELARVMRREAKKVIDLLDVTPTP